jgi:hypothetical protein
VLDRVRGRRAADVELAALQALERAQPRSRLDIGMYPDRRHAVPLQKVGERLGRALGEARDEAALAAPPPRLHLVEQVVLVPAERPRVDDVHLRVEDAGGAHHKLAQPRLRPAHAAHLVARRRRDEHRLRHARPELVARQRPVVERRGQPEAMRDERRLARAVAREHGADLRHGDVALVDEEQPVGRHIVE